LGGPTQFALGHVSWSAISANPTAYDRQIAHNTTELLGWESFHIGTTLPRVPSQ
jgi:hypothetical protein